MHHQSQRIIGHYYSYSKSSPDLTYCTWGVFKYTPRGCHSGQPRRSCRNKVEIRGPDEIKSDKSCMLRRGETWTNPSKYCPGLLIFSKWKKQNNGDTRDHKNEVGSHMGLRTSKDDGDTNRPNGWLPQIIRGTCGESTTWQGASRNTPPKILP